MNHDMDRRTRIAGEIRAELARQSKSVAALSEATGISPATLSRRLSGTRPFLFEELEAVASFLDIPFDMLYARFTGVAA